MKYELIYGFHRLAVDYGDTLERRLARLPDVFADEAKILRADIVPLQSLRHSVFELVPAKLILRHEQH